MLSNGKSIYWCGFKKKAITKKIIYLNLKNYSCDILSISNLYTICFYIVDQIVRLREEHATAERTGDDIGRSRKDKDDLGDLETGPKQVKLAQYPMSYFKFQMRAFNSKWYDSFVWLEYSVEKDAAFCYCCRLFGKQHTRINSDKLQSQGYKNWKKALSSFR